ncbi:MAG: sialidase family protein [Bryobacterales bacterium]
MGFAKVTGGPDDFEGVNVRTESGERLGQGAKGKKASGLLMVDGTLYMAVRTGNAQLAWSEDGGATWTWSDWKFEALWRAELSELRQELCGRTGWLRVPVFAGRGQRLRGRGRPCVGACTERAHLVVKEAYEYFSGMRDDAPPWSSDVATRAGTLVNPEGVSLSVSYDAGLGRYLPA